MMADDLFGNVVSYGQRVLRDICVGLCSIKSP